MLDKSRSFKLVICNLLKTNCEKSFVYIPRIGPKSQLKDVSDRLTDSIKF